VTAILELRDLVVPVPTGNGRARVSLARDHAAFTVVPVDPQIATALARAVVGLIRPLSGRVLVGGRDVTDLPPGSRQIGYVPSGAALLPHLTVRQNIEYLLWRRETVRDLVHSWETVLIRQLELGPVLDLRPHEINDEQRLRAALARAVVSLPEVLVFDLPDSAAAESLRDLLRRVEAPMTAGPYTVVFAGSDDRGGTVHRVVQAVAVVEP
jgi:ABC-type sulfate/molybdate transport systems ATPase subunit